MKTDRISLAVGSVALAGSAAAYFFMPETVPLHWNAAGVIDSWGPRAELLGIGAVPLATALLLGLLPLVDPLRASYARHERTYRVVGRLTVVGLAALSWVADLAALGAPIAIGAVVRLLVGLLMVGLGNFMGRLKRNFFVGIKTPWALMDDEVWRLTHRRGGLVFVAIGAVYVLSLALPEGRPLELLLGGATIAGIAYVFLYSYLAWRRVSAAKEGRGK